MSVFYVLNQSKSGSLYVFSKKTQNRFTTHPPCGWWGFWFGLIKRCRKRDCFIKKTHFSQAFLFPNSQIPVIFCFRKPRFLASVRWGYFFKLFFKTLSKRYRFNRHFQKHFLFYSFCLKPPSESIQKRVCFLWNLTELLQFTLYWRV